jgi:hypothetical protein
VCVTILFKNPTPQAREWCQELVAHAQKCTAEFKTQDSRTRSTTSSTSGFGDVKAPLINLRLTVNLSGCVKP